MASSQSSAASGSSSAASSSRRGATPPTSPHTPQRPSPCLFFDSASACSSDDDVPGCPASPSSGRRPRQRRRLAAAGDENAPPKARVRPVRVVKGTVTPSRAAAIFRMPLATASLPAPAAAPALDACSPASKRLCTEMRKVPGYDSALRSDALTAWRSAGASLDSPRAAALPTRDLGAALLAMRSGAGLRGPRNIPVPLSSYHRTFQPTRGIFLPAGDDSLAAAHPLCGSFSFAAASAAPGRAFLAVGTNDGSIVLRDMSGLAAEPVGLSNYEEMAYGAADDAENSATFRWKACQGSVFDVAWRADDRALVAGGSDYVMRTWDTATLQQTGVFSGPRGSPRSVTWDPSCPSGSVFLSAGRDGAIHLFDTRVTTRVPHSAFRLRHQQEATTPAVMSLWGAHTSLPARPRRGKGSRGGGEGVLLPKGIMSVMYVPSRGAHMVASAGCADGVVKLWDLRNYSAGPSDQASTPEPSDDLAPEMEPCEESNDVTRGPGRFASSHGISSIVASDSTLYAASTNGSIYTLALADLSPTLTPLGRAPALTAPAQRGNTLYARLALSADGRSLALGCNSGTVALWDTWAAARETTHQPAMLQAHAKNFEINAVSWAHGPHGQTLASISDDYSVRLFRPQPLGQAAAPRSCF